MNEKDQHHRQCEVGSKPAQGLDEHRLLEGFFAGVGTGIFSEFDRGNQPGKKHRNEAVAEISREPAKAQHGGPMLGGRNLIQVAADKKTSQLNGGV